MAHEVENVTSGLPIYPFQGWRYVSTGPDLCALGTLTSSSSSVAAVAVAERRGRDASHHTTEDQWGWREPTAYWGYRYVTYSQVPITNQPIAGYTWAGKNYNFGNNSPLNCSSSLPAVWSILYRPNFADLQAQAISAALAELGSATMEAGVELREAQKTANFVGDTLRGVAGLARAVRQGRIPPGWKRMWKKWKGDIPRSFDRAFCQRWLEYRYAWSPMILGVNDALALLEASYTRPLLTTVRKRVEREVGRTVSSQQSSHGTLNPMPCLKIYETVESQSVYVVLTFEPKEQLWVTMNSAGILNPAVGLWETIPFSFVADWVVGVGDYLNALQALRLFSLKGGTATHVHTWTATHTFVWNTTVNTTRWCQYPDVNKATAGGSSFNRGVLDHSHLEAKLLWGKGLNCLRGLDAISLLYSLLRGKSVGKLRV